MDGGGIGGTELMLAPGGAPLKLPAGAVPQGALPCKLPGGALLSLPLLEGECDIMSR